MQVVRQRSPSSRQASSSRAARGVVKLHARNGVNTRGLSSRGRHAALTTGYARYSATILARPGVIAHRVHAPAALAWRSGRQRTSTPRPERFRLERRDSTGAREGPSAPQALHTLRELASLMVWLLNTHAPSSSGYSTAQLHARRCSEYRAAVLQICMVVATMVREIDLKWR